MNAKTTLLIALVTLSFCNSANALDVLRGFWGRSSIRYTGPAATAAAATMFHGGGTSNNIIAYPPNYQQQQPQQQYYQQYQYPQYYPQYYDIGDYYYARYWR